MIIASICEVNIKGNGFGFAGVKDFRAKIKELLLSEELLKSLVNLYC
jgi:hypothetical protein